MPQSKKRNADIPSAEDLRALLSSLIYVFSEVRRSNLPKTQDALLKALASFFEDMREQGNADDDIETCEKILNIILAGDSSASKYFVDFILEFEKSGGRSGSIAKTGKLN